MKKLSAFSNEASLGTYLTPALGAGVFGGNDAMTVIITSDLNETSINRSTPIFINFRNGVISYADGLSPASSLTGFSGFGGENIDPAFISSDQVTSPGAWSFASLQPLPYGTTNKASTQWGGEQTSLSRGGLVEMNQGLSNAYYGLKFYASPGIYNYGWMEVSTPRYGLALGATAVSHLHMKRAA